MILKDKGVYYGLDYGVDNRSERILLNVVKYISFIPMQSDNNKRCTGFPDYNPIGSIYKSGLSFGKDDALSNLDLLVVELQNRPSQFINYVIVYAARNMPEQDYNNLLTTYTVHLYKKRRASPKRIQVVKGGRRDSFIVEVFYLRADDPPPVPSPDYPSI